MAHVRNSRSPGPSPDRPSSARQGENPGVDPRGRSATAAAAGAPAHIRARRARGRRRLPRSPRQERAAQTVEAIVAAAARLLVERGYAAASTNAIAERAGVSIGSLYQYFREKNDVFAAVVARHRREVMPVVTEMLERMRAPNADVVELILELLRRMAEVNRRDPRLLAAIDRELGWLEHQQDDEADARAAAAAVLRRRVSRQGPPVEVVATLLVAIVSPLSRWMVHSKPEGLDTEQLVSAFGRMLRGLLGDDR